MQINLLTSVGDVIDRASIAFIKYKKIDDQRKRKQAYNEYRALVELFPINFIMNYFDRLCVANEGMWDLEDEMRECVVSRDTDKLLLVCRDSHLFNGARAKIKNEINRAYESPEEVKEYSGIDVSVYE